MTDERDDDARREAHDQRFDEQMRAAYERSLEHDAAARERLLSRLAGAGEERESEHGDSGVLKWWFSMQPVTFRPIFVLGALSVLLVAAAWLGARLSPEGPAREPIASVPGNSTPAATSAGSPVTFVLRAPGATRVSVAGDFNNWDAEATPMTHTGTGDMWILNLTLPRGVHRYSFVLDGSEWRPDPSAPLAADETFGGHNSVIVVNGANGL